jgi:tetratricopeptide (TPR) repeat protein
LAAQGAPGVLILAALFALGFLAAWRARVSRFGLSGVLSGSLLAGLVAHQFSVFILPTALYFYLTVAMLAVLPSPLGSTGTRLARGRLIWRIARVAAGAAFLAYAASLLASDAALALVKRRVEAGDVRNAMELYPQVLRWPPRMHADLWYSRSLIAAAQKSPNALLRLQASQEAFAAAIRATRGSEECHNAWYNLATLYAARNDLAGTERSLRAAIACSPNWYKPHWTLAQVLRLSGRLWEAEAESARAVELSGGKHREVDDTWKLIKTELQDVNK